jgi:hypothetical protein
MSTLKPTPGVLQLRRARRITHKPDVAARWRAAWERHMLPLYDEREHPECHNGLTLLYPRGFTPQTYGAHGLPPFKKG